MIVGTSSSAVNRFPTPVPVRYVREIWRFGTAAGRSSARTTIRHFSDARPGGKTKNQRPTEHGETMVMRSLTDDFAPLRLRPPLGEMFGEPVSGPERAHRHAVPGQLVRRTRRGADAPAHGDRDERAHQQPSGGLHCDGRRGRRACPRATMITDDYRLDDIILFYFLLLLLLLLLF